MNCHDCGAPLIAAVDPAAGVTRRLDVIESVAGEHRYAIDDAGHAVAVRPYRSVLAHPDHDHSCPAKGGYTS